MRHGSRLATPDSSSLPLLFLVEPHHARALLLRKCVRLHPASLTSQLPIFFQLPPVLRKHLAALAARRRCVLLCVLSARQVMLRPRQLGLKLGRRQLALEGAVQLRMGWWRIISS